MKVKNCAPRLVTVAGINIIPDTVVEIPDKYAAHPVIKGMLANKELKKVVAESETESETIAPENGAEKNNEKDFSKMTVKEIEAYAQEHGIDLTGAANKEEKIALVQAAVK